jgi:hypothetical protein
MNIDALFPSKYIKASDLDGDPLTLRIAGIETEKMNDGEMKPVLYFSNATKGLVLNKTNANTIKALYGSDTSSWTGKAIQLIATTTEFSGKIVDCIRLRPPAQARSQAIKMNEVIPPHVVDPTGEPESFDDLDDTIPF